MLSNVRLVLLLAGLAVAALVGIGVISRIALTLDAITSQTVLWGYVAAVAALILAVAATAYVVLRGPRRRLRPGAPRANADERLDRLFRQHGFEDSRPLRGYAPLKPGEFCEPEPGGPLVVALCGTRRVGKSSLTRALEAGLPGEVAARLSLRVLPDLGTDPEVNAGILHAIGAAALVIFVVDQDLRHFEFEALRHAARARRPILVAVNKADAFRPAELNETIDAIADKLAGLVGKENIIAVAGAPAPALRLTTLPDGSEREEEVARIPDIRALVTRIDRATAIHKV